MLHDDRLQVPLHHHGANLFFAFSLRVHRTNKFHDEIPRSFKSTTNKIPAKISENIHKEGKSTGNRQQQATDDM